MFDTQPLWQWMGERHRIYLRRKAGIQDPRDWTQDPILRQYRFCNVFRELDTVTDWIRRLVREPYADHPYLMFMICLARTINWPPTLWEIMEAGLWPTDYFAAKEIKDLLKERLSMGQKVYTGAYMIRAEPDGTKDEYVVDKVLRNIWLNQGSFPFFNESLEQAWKWFRQFYGWGPFMSYEVVTDLRHTRYLDKAPDIMEWACAGPGALRGLNRIQQRPLKAPRKQQDACNLMRQLLESPQARDFESEFNVQLEMRDIEHSLCEMDKYLRVLHGEGEPRAKYVHGRGY